MTTIDDLKTRAGLLLYRQLPEEYRFLDNASEGELGDLEAYLHGFGHLLDLIRGTTEQAYADSFAEAPDVPIDKFGNTREIQTWLLPYLAELVGAELLAPDPGRRVEELNNAVGWFKTKGTLRNIDSIADVVSGTETVLVEGWRRVLLTPRLDLPPFTAPASAMGEGDPLGPPSMPLGTPDFRVANQAILDVDGANPLYRLVMPDRDGSSGISVDPIITYWKPRARHGVPCFPGAFDDTALRTPDLRNPDYPDVGPHPRRSLIHIRPPYGFFEPNLRSVALPAGGNPLGFDLDDMNQVQTFGPREVLKAIGDPVNDQGELVTPAPDKIEIEGDLAIPAGLLIAFENLLFTGMVKVSSDGVKGPTLTLSKCAVKKLHVDLPAGHAKHPMVVADDSLFGEIEGVHGFAQLVHCTVLGNTILERLWASDCLFNGDLDGVNCAGEKTCVRYSRLPDRAALEGCLSKKSPTNTTDDPNFARFYFRDGPKCKLRPAAFGEPGCGVLDLTTSPAIRQGAEDDGEMGAYHHLYHSAQLRAVKLKLRDFLPHGQEIAIRYDPRLTRPAPALE